LLRKVVLIGEELFEFVDNEIRFIDATIDISLKKKAQ
jgi:hypothetical protein